MSPDVTVECSPVEPLLSAHSSCECFSECAALSVVPGLQVDCVNVPLTLQLPLEL